MYEEIQWLECRKNLYLIGPITQIAKNAIDAKD